MTSRNPPKFTPEDSLIYWFAEQIATLTSENESVKQYVITTLFENKGKNFDLKSFFIKNNFFQSEQVPEIGEVIFQFYSKMSSNSRTSLVRNQGLPFNPDGCVFISKEKSAYSKNHLSSYEWIVSWNEQCTKWLSNLTEDEKRFCGLSNTSPSYDIWKAYWNNGLTKLQRRCSIQESNFTDCHSFCTIMTNLNQLAHLVKQTS